MKVGDLVRCYGSVGLIVQSDEWETLVKWCDDGIVENVNMYSNANMEIISESR